MSRSIVSHTADAGLEVRSPTFPGLLVELAEGMFELMAPLDGRTASATILVGCAADSQEQLVVDLLSELLHRSEAEDMFLFAFRVSSMDGPHRRVEIEADGTPTDEIELSGAPIKAVTYHDLVVREDADGWFGRVYFDV